MSEEHVKGGLEKIGGRLKEAAGTLTGNDNLKAEGQLDQLKGGAHQMWGDVKDAARDTAARFRQTGSEAEHLVDREKDKPL